MRARAKLWIPEHIPERFDTSLGDTRFRNLLSREEWSALSPDVRRRFSKRVADGCAVIYAGRVVDVELSRFGRLLAQMLRIIGGPLPRRAETGVPAVVSVTEDHAGGGQIWTRFYGSRRGLPQIIHTAKCFRGKTGLEEYLGFGLGMSLVVTVENGSIVFRSAGYFVKCLGRNWTLPEFLCPGALTVTHEKAAGGAFGFTLHLAHPYFGLLVHQHAIFREVLS